MTPLWPTAPPMLWSGLHATGVRSRFSLLRRLEGAFARLPPEATENKLRWHLALVCPQAAAHSRRGAGPRGRRQAWLEESRASLLCKPMAMQGSTICTRQNASLLPPVVDLLRIQGRSVSPPRAPAAASSSSNWRGRKTRRKVRKDAQRRLFYSFSTGTAWHRLIKRFGSGGVTPPVQPAGRLALPSLHRAAEPQLSARWQRTFVAGVMACIPTLPRPSRRLVAVEVVEPSLPPAAVRVRWIEPVVHMAVASMAANRAAPRKIPPLNQSGP